MAWHLFLATKCVTALANQIENQLPEIVKIIRKDFYVDDLLIGANMIEEAIDISKTSHRF